MHQQGGTLSGDKTHSTIAPGPECLVAHHDTACRVIGKVPYLDLIENMG